MGIQELTAFLRSEVINSWNDSDIYSVLFYVVGMETGREVWLGGFRNMRNADEVASIELSFSRMLTIFTEERLTKWSFRLV